MAEIKIKRSKVKNNYLPKLPTASQISEGELAMNYAKGAETLSFRNESGDIVTISADVEVETLSSAPTESTIFRSNGKPYKIGDEVRVTDSDTGSTSGYKFYKLYNITDSGTVAIWDVSAGGHSEVREQVNITLTSNQAQPDNNLNGATVTVTDTTNNTNVITETWQGDTIIAYVNALSAYKIEVSEVEGYTTPQSQSYTAQIGTERDVNFYYNCCKLTVNIDGINGQSSTVKYGSVSKTVADGGSINVPYGSSITISCNSVNGYAKPSDVTFTANTASKTVTMTYVASALKVNINSNQSNDTAITSLKATVTYGSTTVEASSGQTISVPTDQQVTVTFPTVTGYKTPSSFSFTNTNGGLVESSVTYQTEVVTVTVTSDDSTSVAGQVITINGSSQTLTSTGVVSQKVPYGTTYTISASAKSGYIAPQSQSFTASQVARSVSMLYKKAVAYYITINQTVTSPSSMISSSVTDNTRYSIEWIRSNSHRYLGKYVSGDDMMYLCQLDDNNSEKFSDGTTATLTGGSGDVFMKLPTFYYKAEKTSGNNWKVWFSMGKVDSTWKTWAGNDLIGAFEAIYTSSKLRSIKSTNQSSGSISWANFRTYARNRYGENHGKIVTWEQHCMMAFLYYAYYCNTDCQTQCGSGYSSYQKPCGQQLSMIDTTSSNGNTELGINFWGLENWWGDKAEWIDNVSGGSNVFKVTTYDGTTGAWGNNRNATAYSPDSYYIAHMTVGEYLDASSLDSTSASDSTGYCDYFYNGGSSCIVCRSSVNSVSSGGVACADASYSPSYTYTYFGSRLSYVGPWTEVSVSEFNAITSFA